MTPELTLAPHLRSLPHSETLRINERCERLALHRPVVRFGFGQSPFPVPDRLQRALAEHAHEKAYAPVQGLAELRTAVADFHRREDSVDWHADRVLIGPGSKLLIYAALAAFREAHVFLTSPSWVSYAPQAQLAGHQVTRLASRAENQWRLQPEDLAAACRTVSTALPRILILNFPNNPAGSSYEEAHLQALAEVARQHEVLVISDEIYGRLHHQGAHSSFAEYYPEGTLVTGGLSKWCGAGGWRLGILHIPEALEATLKPILLGVASETWSCVSTPIQRAAVAAYSGHPEIEQFVARQRTVLGHIGRAATERLNNMEVRTAFPEGGFYLFPDFELWRPALAARGIRTAAELCEHLLAEAGVALLPGSAFGMPADQLTTRLSYVNIDGAAALDASTDLDTIAEPVLQGIELIHGWLRPKV
ncbi:pyridoxal phosphate-dependent aminotransferase [Natronospirillum operosum]|uniref:pyridoxal phosphate-dependent aminotransferase n=1 Tax=Natronospirillum operosum TaxID=2759953 RepID=UPI001F0E8225|nr:aminotransferase class I/II-fold pyridoxal phosphate-dependent enzyme [Natronospirillum operosum]